jgi:hypothetical protein
LVDIFARDIGRHHDAVHLEILGATLQLPHAVVHIDHWQPGKRHEAPDGGNSARVVSDTFLRDVSAAGNGVRIRASDPGDRWISYRADGMLNEGGNALAIAVCDDRGEANGRDITVSLVGRVSVTSPSADCTP